MTTALSGFANAIALLPVRTGAETIVLGNTQSAVEILPIILQLSSQSPTPIEFVGGNIENIRCKGRAIDPNTIPQSVAPETLVDCLVTKNREVLDGVKAAIAAGTTGFEDAAVRDILQGDEKLYKLSYRPDLHQSSPWFDENLILGQSFIAFLSSTSVTGEAT